LLAIHEPLAFQSRLYCSLQIFGGGMLILTFVSQLGASSSTASLVVGAVLAALGLASIVLGIRWLEHDRRVAGWCFVLWALQVVIFALPSVSYSFSCGAILPASLEFPFSLSLSAPRLGVQFVARLNREGPVSYIGVNLIAVVACRFFLMEWRNASLRDGATVPKTAP
jgi:hypothetical protein